MVSEERFNARASRARAHHLQFSFRHPGCFIPNEKIFIPKPSSPNPLSVLVLLPICIRWTAETAAMWAVYASANVYRRRAGTVIPEHNHSFNYVFIGTTCPYEYWGMIRVEWASQHHTVSSMLHRCGTDDNWIQALVFTDTWCVFFRSESYVE